MKYIKPIFDGLCSEGSGTELICLTVVVVSVDLHQWRSLVIMLKNYAR